MSKIVVFGASGGTGKHIIEQCLQEGHEVTAFVRNSAKLPFSSETLNVYQGDVRNFTDVLEVVENQDIVICALGLPANKKSTLRADGTANIVRAMEQTGVKRLICQSTWGILETRRMLPWHLKYLIVPLILKNAFMDHENQEKIIERSALDWTILRPGNLTDGPSTGNYHHGFRTHENVKLKISRADVAHFIISEIGNIKYLHKKPGLSYGR